MAYKFVFSPVADRQITNLDNSVAVVTYKKLKELEKLEDPRTQGKLLTGNLSGFWRYRVDDYRIICEMFDIRAVVLVIEIAHRSKAY